MATVALVIHHLRSHAVDTARRAVDWLGERSHAVLLPVPDAVAVGRPELSADDDALSGPVDLVVALGGDGTVLRAVRLVAYRGAPVLSVNLGRLGYLTETEPDELDRSLDRALAGDCQLEDRMMLQVTVEHDGVAAEPVLALNEAVLEKPAPGNTVHLTASIGGRPWTTYVGDGLIVASPTGSTAYSFSARGPIVSPRLRALVLTPVSPHMAFDRSLVMSQDEPVRVEVTDDRPAALTVDGQSRGFLDMGDSIVCGVASEPVRFVTFGERDFFGVLKAKFKVSDR